MGAVTLAMMSLIEDAPDLATWERAMLYTIDQVRNRKVKVNRSKLEELRTKYEKVYHFWGAWEDSEPGLNERHEFDERLLCAKATNFHNVIAAWNNSRSIEQAEVFDAPEITDVSATREYTIDIELVPKTLGGLVGLEKPRPIGKDAPFGGPGADHSELLEGR